MRPLHIFILASAFFVFLIIHVFKMQVIDHEVYKAQSERNRIRPVILEAPRGVILDRYGREMVSNRLAFDCYIIPQEGKANLEASLKRLAAIVYQSEDQLMERYKSKKKGAFTPVLLIQDMGKEEAIRIEEEADELPGVFIKTRPVREYQLGAAASHVLGYVGAIDAAGYKELKEYGYRMTDLIGKDGIEKTHESYLKGKSGAVQYETDSRGRLLEVLSIQEPVEGKSVQLSLDLDLQLHVHELMESQMGAIAVMELNQGGVLALVSEPSFDPNIFARPSKYQKDIVFLLKDPKKPLINRAIAGEYPPGSTFKMVSAHTGLNNGKINSNTSFFCPGYFHVGRHRFNCWRHQGHGAQDLIQGIQHSCNVFFYNLGMKLDVAAISKEARAFGLGQKTSIELPAEKKGLVPTRDWKRKRFRESWYRGETINYIIGQGFLLVTPLQMMRATGVVASGGTLFAPFLAQKIADVDQRKGREKKVFDGRHLRIIQRGMKEVVQSRTGTGQRARSPKVSVAGKTGTAQASQGEDHAWFVGFAPTDEPQVAVVVFLEHGGKGGYSAASLAGKTLTWMAEHGYFG